MNLTAWMEETSKGIDQLANAAVLRKFGQDHGERLSGQMMGQEIRQRQAFRREVIRLLSEVLAGTEPTWEHLEILTLAGVPQCTTGPLPSE